MITIKRLKHAHAKDFPVNFIPCTAQHGDIGYKEKPIFSKGRPLVKYQIQFRKLDTEIENIKIRLKQCFSENSLQFWDINKIMEKLEMKDKNKIIRVRPMRYNLEDKEEFNKQINKLLKLKFIQPSESPHSLHAFMVRNHSEIVRGKERMVINYKKLNSNIIFDGYFFTS